MAVSSTRLPKRMMIMAMTTAAITCARRVLDPAAVTIDVADIEPPTGMPWNVPETRLPTP